MDEKIELINSMSLDLGLQGLVNTGCEILGNPILIHDMDYKVVCHTANVKTDDPIWNEYAEYGTVGPKTHYFFRTEKFIERAADAKFVTLLTSHKLKYDRIYCKLFNINGQQVGCAVMVGIIPFDKGDARLFEQFCEKVNQQMATLAQFTLHGQEYQQRLISALINGNVVDRQIYQAHVESVYIGLKSNIFLAVVQAQKKDSAYKVLEEMRELAKDCKYCEYDNRLLILFSSHTTSIDLILKQLNHSAKRNNAFVGISHSFDNLFKLDEYYKDALLVLSTGQSASFCGERVFVPYNTEESCGHTSHYME